MGSPMAMNLLRAGYTVNVYNRSPEKAVALVEAGATQFASPKEAIEHSDVIFLMLSDSNAIQSVLNQDEGILEAIKPGKVIIDMSTISPKESQTFAELISAKAGIYLDAPVSGSVGAAQTAQLVILVGGDNDTVETCLPYFNVLGKKIMHFGSSGKGSAAKLAINLLLGVLGQGIAETLLFADKSGLEKEQVLEMISQSGMNSPLFQAKKEMYRNNAFPSAFMLELMAKDLGLIKGEADRLGTLLPLAEVANTTYLSAKESGKAKMDMAAIYLELRERNNV